MSVQTDYYIPELEKAEATIAVLRGRASRLELALKLALASLAASEPNDSRAVSSEFVALAAVAEGIEDAETMTIINRARRACG